MTMPHPYQAKATKNWQRNMELKGWAWKAIYQYVFALAHGTSSGTIYFGDWIRKPGVAICSCNDGLRPVIFKLEATDEESVIDYTPVNSQK